MESDIGVGLRRAFCASSDRGAELNNRVCLKDTSIEIREAMTQKSSIGGLFEIRNS